MKKYTLDEIHNMLSDNNFFAYNTPIGNQADKHAADYDYDDGLDVEEAVRDAFVYGAHWVIDHLNI